GHWLLFLIICIYSYLGEKSVTKILDHAVNDVCQNGAILRAECRCDAILRRLPAGTGGFIAGSARLRKIELAAAPVVVVGGERHIALSLQRAKVAGQRRRVHHKLSREGADIDATEAKEMPEDAILGDCQAEGFKLMIVDLRHPSCRLAKAKGAAGRAEIALRCL